MSIQRSLSIVAIVLLPVVMYSVRADESKTPTVATKPLLEKTINLPSTQLKTNVLRVIFPPAFKTPLHTHEGPGPRYVVRGRIRIEEGGVSHDYAPGDVFWESGQWMTAENVGEGEAEILVIELVSAR